MLPQHCNVNGTTYNMQVNTYYASQIFPQSDSRLNFQSSDAFKGLFLKQKIRALGLVTLLGKEMGMDSVTCSSATVHRTRAIPATAPATI